MTIYGLKIWSRHPDRRLRLPRKRRSVGNVYFSLVQQTVCLLDGRLSVVPLKTLNSLHLVHRKGLAQLRYLSFAGKVQEYSIFLSSYGRNVITSVIYQTTPQHCHSELNHTSSYVTTPLPQCILLNHTPPAGKGCGQVRLTLCHLTKPHPNTKTFFAPIISNVPTAF